MRYKCKRPNFTQIFVHSVDSLNIPVYFAPVNRTCCIPEVVDAGEVVLGVDVDDAGGVVGVTPKTRTHVLRNGEAAITRCSVSLVSAP